MKNPLRAVNKCRVAIAMRFRPYVDKIMAHKLIVAGVILFITFPWRGIVTHLLHGATHVH